MNATAPFVTPGMLSSAFWSLVVLEDKIGVLVPGLGLEGQVIVSIPGNLTQKLTSYEGSSKKTPSVEKPVREDALPCYPDSQSGGGKYVGGRARIRLFGW